MIAWVGICLAGRRLPRMRLQVNSWTFSSSFRPQIVQAVSQHSLWTMRRCRHYTFHPNASWPAQQLPRSVVRPPACSPRLGRQSSSVLSPPVHRVREALVDVNDASSCQSSNAATSRPTRPSPLQQQLYTSPAACRRSKLVSSSAVQPSQGVTNHHYVAPLSAVPPQQHQQQQLGIQAPPSSRYGCPNHPSNQSINHSQRNSSSLSPAQYRAQHRSRSSSSSLSPAQYRAQNRNRSSSSSLSPAQHRAQNSTNSRWSSSSSSSISSPLPDSSSSGFDGHAAAAAAEASSNSYGGSSNRHFVAMSNVLPIQQQQLLGIHAPTSSSWDTHGSHSSSADLHYQQRNRSSSSLSPAECRAQSRATGTLSLPEFSSSTSSGSSTCCGDAAADASSKLLQQRLQEVIRPLRRQRTGSISVSRPPLKPPQQQQQQQYVQGSSSDSRYCSTYQPQPIPPELLQPPPAGPLHLDVTAMLSWNDGSPPGFEKFTSRRLPVHLDHTTLMWLSVYQPGGPGTSAAIWIGRTWLETLDSSRSDHARSDLAGSDHADPSWQLQTLDRSVPDQISTAARGGILLSTDLISAGHEAVDLTEHQQQPLPALVQQQQQQEPESEEDDSSEDAALVEHLGNQLQQQQQQQHRQRQQQLQPSIPPVKQQTAAASRLWLEVQQRPDLGLAPAAVVEGLTFARHSRMSTNSSSSSNGGTGSDISLDSSEKVEELVHSTSATVAGHNPWYDYMLLVSGDFSVVDHENMFPNVIVHCSDGRVSHNARSAADVAAFVAEADEFQMQAHILNLLGYAWNQPESYGAEWVINRVRDRWGVEAMIRFGVNWSYLNARLSAKGVQ